MFGLAYFVFKTTYNRNLPERTFEEKSYSIIHDFLYGQAKALSSLNDWFLTFPAAFKSELQVLISACRMTRAYIDQVCYSLISNAVVIMDVSIL